NVIDKFRDVFADDGNQFIGRGPARAVNVYFNGKKIVTQTPEPVIFTGGISPALWSPVVSFNAFDVPSIDVDVSGLLPYLWEHQASQDTVLEIEISNVLGEIGKDDKLSVNENWITTANLLTFENDQVVESSGEVLSIEDSGRGHVFALSPYFTRSLQQVVSADLRAQLISNIVLKLKNDTVINSTISSYSAAEIANVQNYKRSGDRQSIVHVGHSSHSILIQDNDVPEFFDDDKEHSFGRHKKGLPENAIIASNVSLKYPLVLKVDQSAKELDSHGGFSVDLDVKLVHSKGSDHTLGGGIGNIKTSSSQNGTSHFVISSKGNHGAGATTSKYESKFKFGRHGREYSRVVDAVNGTIVSDKTDTHRDDSKDNFASVVDVVENTSNQESAFELSERILKALNGKHTDRARTPCHGNKGMRGTRGHHRDARHPGSH
ncbi:Peptide-N4-(N-acetyl-beta-glucosaminyl)asparagine amidase A, partial [Candida tropicalis]